MELCTEPNILCTDGTVESAQGKESAEGVFFSSVAHKWIVDVQEQEGNSPSSFRRDTYSSSDMMGRK